MSDDLCHKRQRLVCPIGVDPDVFVSLPYDLQLEIIGDQASNETKSPVGIKLKQQKLVFGSKSDHYNSSTTLSRDYDHEHKQLPFIDDEFPPNADSIDGRHLSKISSNAIIEKPPNCKCNKSTIIKKVSKNGSNNGRYFYSCSNQFDKCNYFKWADNACHDSSILTIEWVRFNSNENWIVTPTKSYCSDDVVQGQLGNCWFLSALSILANRQDLMNQVILSKGAIPEHGKLEFALFIDGYWKLVNVDNYLPCRAGVPIFARIKANYTYVSFLEKAYAKCHGSYQALSGGEISEALLDLTGFPCTNINFSSQNFDSEEAWILLLSYAELKFPMGCSAYVSGEGIVGCHAYSILEVREISNANLGYQMKVDEWTSSKLSSCNKKHEEYISEYETIRVLKLRNPWGKKEFNGTFSHHSDVWTTKLEKILSKTTKNDGNFYISYHDFLKRFESVDICHAHPVSCMNRDAAHPRGCIIDRENIERNDWSVMSYPIKMIQRSEYDYAASQILSITLTSYTWLYIMILQKTKRGRNHNEKDQKYYYQPLSLILTASLSPMKVMYSHFNAPKRDSMFELQLEAQEYFLLPLNLNCNLIEDFYIRIYSSNPINVRTLSTNNLIKQRVDEAFLRTIYFNIRLNASELIVPSQHALSGSNVIDLVNEKNNEIQNIQLTKFYQNDVVFITASLGYHSDSDDDDLHVSLGIKSSNYHWITPYAKSTASSTTLSKHTIKKLSFIIPKKSYYKTIIGILYKEQLYESINVLHEHSILVIDYTSNIVPHEENNYCKIPLYFRPYRII